jgi:phosphoribosylformylglycinamidine synthase
MAHETSNIEEFNLENIGEPEDINEVIYSLMVNPNLSQLNYFNDFSESIPDPRYMGNEDVDSSGVFELNHGSVRLVMTTHAIHHHVETDPKTAMEILISRATRKMVCFGATPIAVTSMLYHIDFGDPNGHLIASEAKRGLEDAAKAFKLKISDRKIRFDHFTGHEGLNPTIIVSLLGAYNELEKPMTPSFKVKGNNIFMLGRSVEDIASSEYLEFYHGITVSKLPQFDLPLEVKVQNAVRELIQKGLVQSASPVAKGGLFFTLMRSGWVNELGFDITTDAEIRRDAFLFGESMGRIIVGVHPDSEDDFVDFMTASKVPFFTLGHVTKGEIRIDDESYGFIDKMSSNL